MNNTIRKLLAERQSALEAEDTKLRQKLQSSIHHEITYAKGTFAHQVDLKFQTDSKSSWTNLKSLLKLNDNLAECSVDANTLNTLDTESVIVPDTESVIVPDTESVIVPDTESVIVSDTESVIVQIV